MAENARDFSHEMNQPFIISSDAKDMKKILLSLLKPIIWFQNTIFKNFHFMNGI